MKNLIYIGTAAAALLYFLRQKRAAGENLRVEPVDIAIDSARSSSSFWTRIYYNVKLKLINAENASVNVSAINLNVLVNNTPFGSINNTTGFIVAAGSEKIVNLEASFSSLGVIEAIRDLIADGFRFNVAVSGYVDTDLGRIKVQFSKNVGGSGVSAPMEIITKRKLYLVRDSKGKYLQNSFSGPKWVANREMASSWEDEALAQKIANFHGDNIELY